MRLNLHTVVCTTLLVRRNEKWSFFLLRSNSNHGEKTMLDVGHILCQINIREVQCVTCESCFIFIYNHLQVKWVFPVSEMSFTNFWILEKKKKHFIQHFSSTLCHKIESAENFLKVPGTWPIFCSKLCRFFFVDITSFCNCKNVYQILGGIGKKGASTKFYGRVRRRENCGEVEGCKILCIYNFLKLLKKKKKKCG